MSPIFDAYGSVPALRSALLQNPSALAASSIPPTETLASLQQELEDLKRRAGERAEKAERDIKILADVWRQAKAHEKEKNRERDHGPVDRHHKGKAKPPGGHIKREQSGTWIGFITIGYGHALILYFLWIPSTMRLTRTISIFHRNSSTG